MGELLRRRMTMCMYKRARLAKHRVPYSERRLEPPCLASGKNAIKWLKFSSVRRQGKIRRNLHHREFGLERERVFSVTGRAASSGHIGSSWHEGTTRPPTPGAKSSTARGRVAEADGSSRKESAPQADSSRMQSAREPGRARPRAQPSKTARTHPASCAPPRGAICALATACGPLRRAALLGWHSRASSSPSSSLFAAGARSAGPI